MDELTKLPPHDQSAEAGILGCVFLQPHECLEECMDKLKQGGAMFYDLRNRRIYELLVEMFTAKEAIDVITVKNRLGVDGLRDVGGISYLATLPDLVPSAANISFYISIVREKYLLRRFSQFFSEAQAKIQEHVGMVEELVDGFGKEVNDIIELRAQVGEPVSMKEYVRLAVEEMERKATSDGKPTGLKSGLIDLDRWTGGMHPGQLIVIAARPSVGKSSLAMNIVEEVALNEGGHCAVFSLEMQGEELAERMLYSRAKVDGRKMARDGISIDDGRKLMGVAAKLGAANIHIIDKAGLNILQIKAAARRLHRKHGLKLVVVDYLQLVSPMPSKSGKTRTQEVGEVSIGCKELAKELGIPVILLSQLNREIEKEKNRRPRLSDLRESGSIEQDCDTCIFIWDRFAPDDGDASGPREVTLYIAKNRSGPRGVDVGVFFNNVITRFENLSRVKE